MDTGSLKRLELGKPALCQDECQEAGCACKRADLAASVLLPLLMGALRPVSIALDLQLQMRGVLQARSC